MQALFLVFLAAAWLSELVLALGLAQDTPTRRASLTLGLAAGAVVLFSALLALPSGLGTAFPAAPARLHAFMPALCFMCVLMQLASGRVNRARLKAGTRQWRVSLPLLSGNLAVLAYSITQALPKSAATLAASLGLTITVALLVPVAVAVLDRLHISLLPAWMRGTPIIFLSAAFAALALTGLAPVRPW